ncbi:gamma-tubulin complex component 5 isoform X4 [Panthera pardus]|uniref:Gamma-tubulin complex component n=2 Tax=Felidae TaxID=9681 RepID=A0A9V1F1Z4_PANPR|nr:gamma-tubulin complex component 5 isoform X4 [Panthera tigris]XP_019293700.1 gamma-tubulin complex component 5 isoform X4 [Panthera pardus]XP_030173464.1 gamma-tubulin complex component 5 isoform X4 [Lynx canadensis]XP_040349836.1 gamma-tubulin complex component 5 isoform X4 [Puma yagouaroundi]XP_042797227.1 gamma-tubulin complex component 5 isoform X4 [Panthera leo]XP_046942551.1 gamma-tubulin complex component 5 isoform X4 [Lynx rufus]
MFRPAPSWSQLDPQQERDVRELIRHVAGLQDEADPNFQLALHFAWSNFRFHHFLDVNSHKVEKTIEGIYEKFIIHSDLSKAASWKRLTEEFLNASLLSIKEIKTDVHYSILSLLLCLSDSPSNSNYVETPRDKEVEKKDDFDWGKYLMEGEEIALGPNVDTPNWSEESEDEDDQQPLSREDSGIQVDRTPLEEQDQNRKLGPRVSWKGGTPTSSSLEGMAMYRNIPCIDCMSGNVGWLAGDIAVDEPNGRSWLEQHVVHQYWTARSSRFPHSLHLHSNLASVWDQHLYSSDPLYVPDDRVFVTETQVIRETLWLLSGVKKLFIYQLIDGKVTVRNSIIVTHLTHSCLRSVLEQIAAYGQVVFRLQEFIDEVMGHSSESMLPGNGSLPKKLTEAPFRTYQAFMWALYKYFISFKKELTDIEKYIINNDTTITLAIVVDKLSPRLAQLKVLHKVFSTGVAEVPPDTRNVVRASHLLNTLYKAILEYDIVGEASEQTVSLLFSLWVETVRPYLQIVDEWIVHGHLCDCAREFIIQRNKNVPVNHRDFWYATYTLYSVSEKTENEEKMSDNASASSGSDQGPSSRQHTMVSFLKPVLKQIIMAGKSMQLLKNLQCAKSTTCQDTARDAERKSLYTLFLESVQSRLRHGEDSTAQVLTEQQATKENLIKMQSIAERHLELDDVHDPLLAINFARLYLEQSDFHEKFAGEDICVDRSSESVTCQTFELTLRSCLYPHIDKQYLECCGNLMQTLKKDYRLVEYLQAMRNFFLMEGGDTMYDFYTSIFDKIREKETWQNVSFLNVQLQEAVGQRYPEDSSRLSISYENVDTTKKKLPVHILDGLTLSYKIKWAKYSLDVLLFGELTSTAGKPQFREGLLCEEDTTVQFGPQKETVRQQIHRMFLLRVKLMHFVNSLHNYIMTRILHSTGLEFQHQVEEAKDLDQLIKIHYRYLSTIHDRCLLREKVSFVKEAIMKVLNLALMFADGWQAGLGAWQMESIEKMESDFKNCHMFIVTILNKAVCRGSFPHLESLALSLMAGMEQS